MWYELYFDMGNFVIWNNYQIIYVYQLPITIIKRLKSLEIQIWMCVCVGGGGGGGGCWVVEGGGGWWVMEGGGGGGGVMEGGGWGNKVLPKTVRIDLSLQ